MAESRETGPAVARTCLGGLTLLLALTLSVRSVAVAPGSASHRPAMVYAVARFIAGVTADAPDSRECGAAVLTVRRAMPADRSRPTHDGPRDVHTGVLLELMNLPPPACA